MRYTKHDNKYYMIDELFKVNDAVVGDSSITLDKAESWRKN